jgi:hypothetical protein
MQNNFWMERFSCLPQFLWAMHLRSLPGAELQAFHSRPAEREIPPSDLQPGLRIAIPSQCLRSFIQHQHTQDFRNHKRVSLACGHL